jgi:hypothetical protein
MESASGKVEREVEEGGVRWGEGEKGDVKAKKDRASRRGRRKEVENIVGRCRQVSE